MFIWKKEHAYTIIPALLFLGMLIYMFADFSSQAQKEQVAVGQVEAHVEQSQVAMDQWLGRYEMAINHVAETSLNGPDAGSIRNLLQQIKKEVPEVISVKLISVHAGTGRWEAGKSQLYTSPEMQLESLQMTELAQQRLEQVVRVDGIPLWFRNAQGWFGERQPLTFTVAKKINKESNNELDWILCADIAENTWQQDMNAFLHDPTVNIEMYNSYGESLNVNQNGETIAHSMFFLNEHGEHSSWVQTVNGINSVVVTRTMIHAPWTIVGYKALAVVGGENQGTLIVYIIFVACILGAIIQTRTMLRNKRKLEFVTMEMDQMMEEVKRLKLELTNHADREGENRSEAMQMLMQRDTWFRQVKVMEKQIQSMQQQQQIGLQLWKHAISRSRSLLYEVLDVLQDLNAKRSDRWSTNEALHLLDQIELYLTLTNNQTLLIPKPLNLRDLVNESWDDSALKHGGNTVGLRNEVSSVLPEVAGDEVRLKYLFSYLFSQIMLVSKRGQLIVEAELSGGWLTVMIKEPGFSVDLGQWEALFGGKEMNRSLGSAIANQIILLHGGTARVETNDRLGCAFVFTLPLASGKNAEEFMKLHT